MKRALLALALMATPALADDLEIQTRGEMKIGNWDLSAHEFKKNRLFTHCTAAVTYNANGYENRRKLGADHVNMYVKADVMGGYEFMIQAPQWRVTPKKAYKIVFNFDGGRASFTLNAEAADTEAIWGSFTADTFDAGREWINAFAGANYVQISIAGRDIGGFKLNGSARALNGLLNCQAGGIQSVKERQTAQPKREAPKAGNRYDITEDTF